MNSSFKKDINNNEIFIDASKINHRDLNQTLKKMIASNDDGPVSFVIENVLGQRYIGDGIAGNATIKIKGVPGNDLAAFMDGPVIEIFGNAQDGVGNTMNSGKIIVHGNCGDIAGYSMRGGEIYIEGDVGWRSGIHMKSYLEKFPVIVIGGKAGNFLGEYMAGGVIILLGLNKEASAPAGDYIGTGMHGGSIFIQGSIEDYKLGKEVKKMPIDNNDKILIQKYTENFCSNFGLDINKIISGDFKDFIKLAPYSHRPYGKLYAYWPFIIQEENMIDIDLNDLKTGMLGEARTRVTEENTALKFGSGSVKVFATPAMIGLMEKASINCVDNFLPDGYASVGTRVDVRHLAATPVGMEVAAEAQLIEIDGFKLKFNVAAFDGSEKIGEGTHFRYIVKLDDFLKNADKKVL